MGRQLFGDILEKYAAFDDTIKEWMECNKEVPAKFNSREECEQYIEASKRTIPCQGCGDDFTVYLFNFHTDICPRCQAGEGVGMAMVSKQCITCNTLD